ncbi:MAG: hypothetical protein JWM36_1438 [Hyphomicrobiales bacterium]|nr:hypothetical protein [Hyphomicrobiales bacterium]
MNAGNRVQSNHSRMIMAGVAVFLLAFVVSLLLGHISKNGGWAAADQDGYHLPQVNSFIRDGFKLSYDSTSATTPLSHLVYAKMATLFGIQELRQGDLFINAVSATAASTALVCLFVLTSMRSGSLLCGALCVLSVFSSSYFILPSIYLVTEAVAFIFYFGLLLISVSVSDRLLRAFGFASFCSLLVLTRQVFLPVAASFALASLGNLKERVHWLSAGRLLVLAGTIGLPALVFIPFYLTWGGLVHPNFAQYKAHTINVALIVHNIELLGLFAPPFILLCSSSRFLTNRHLLTAVASFFAALIIVASVDLGFDEDAGRFFSVIWSISRLEDSILSGYRIVSIVLVTVGLFTLADGLCSTVFDSRFSIEWPAFVTYTAALSVQPFAWQRYVEMFVLVTLCVWASGKIEELKGWKATAFASIFAVYFAISVVFKIWLPGA